MGGGAGASRAQRLPAALRRVLPRIGGIDVLERMSALSGSDFTTVMLEVARRRAARESPASMLRRYRDDRFVRPGGTSWWSLRRAEDVLVSCLPETVETANLPTGATQIRAYDPSRSYEPYRGGPAGS